MWFSCFVVVVVVVVPCVFVIVVVLLFVWLRYVCLFCRDACFMIYFVI